MRYSSELGEVAKLAITTKLQWLLDILTDEEVYASLLSSRIPMADGSGKTMIWESMFSALLMSLKAFMMILPSTPAWKEYELLEPNQVRFLPAYRSISDEDKSRILVFSKTGISVQQMMQLMELEKCVELGFLPFSEKDVRNVLQSFKKLDPDEENIDFLRMCQTTKEKDPNF